MGRDTTTNDIPAIPQSGSAETSDALDLQAAAIVVTRSIKNRSLRVSVSIFV